MEKTFIRLVGRVSSNIERHDNYVAFYITDSDNKIPVFATYDIAKKIIEDEVRFGTLISLNCSLKSEEVLTKSGLLKVQLTFLINDYAILENHREVIINNDYLEKMLALEDLSLIGGKKYEKF